ncbi:MAG: alpha/beta fold hydrolase [Acidimicrobiales bacterium]
MTTVTAEHPPPRRLLAGRHSLVRRAEQGRQRYPPHRRGHVDADRPAEGYPLANFAADVVAFNNAVGIGRAVLVGISSGGPVALLVAGIHPDRVSGLVLISTPVTLADKPGVAEMWKAVSLLEDPIDCVFVDEFVRSTAPDECPRKLIDTLVGESLRAPPVAGLRRCAAGRGRPDRGFWTELPHRRF